MFQKGNLHSGISQFGRKGSYENRLLGAHKKAHKIMDGKNLYSPPDEKTKKNPLEK